MRRFGLSPADLDAIRWHHFTCGRNPDAPYAYLDESGWPDNDPPYPCPIDPPIVHAPCIECGDVVDPPGYERCYACMTREEAS